MIGFVWRRLPGPRPVRCLAMVVGVVVIAAILWYGIFPLVSDLVPIGNPAME
ncbi:hypothetical protein [Kribbella sp.]|uniref:hypothetical protein n=1 Tax=Kribbella sp. TaxID=1871183 RepID=UPI002D4B2BCA|nr:hypothetical protein [Kribbella sp.]HZX02116.1 hypothetical protein [Kribbella sp.]